MNSVYTSGLTPDPSSALDVLAFILCPLTAFAPDGDAEELEAVAMMIAPAKEEAIRNFLKADRLRNSN